ncbi:MAG: L,D-transpeptidase family protein [Candidatus Sumerlaeaceae bacterium]
MRRSLFLVAILAVVFAALAGGTAFIVQQGRLGELQRMAAQAEDMIKSRAYDDAVAILRKVEARGGTARSSMLLGKIYYDQGKYDQAMPWFQRIVEKFPDSDYVADALLYKARYKLDVDKDANSARELLLTILSKWSKSKANDFALVHLARMSLNAGDDAQAKKNLDIVLKKEESPARDEAEFLIGDINMRALKSPNPGSGDETYEIKKGDTIWALERRLKIPGDLLMAINGITQNLSVGTAIKIPRVEFSIVIDKAERTLLLRNHGQFLKKYKVGINRDDATLPPDQYSVSQKFDKGYDYTDPKTNQPIKPGQPGNPYGTRFLSLRREVGIHGTEEPQKVGTYITKGVVAMTNPDIEELYGLVQAKPATPVTVKNHVQAEGPPGK